MTQFKYVVVMVAVLAIGSQTEAGDWPQFLGPKRNGVSTEKGLITTWSRKGPRQIWQRKVGEGFAGPVITGHRLILFHRVGDKDVVECLDAKTGKTKWKTPYSTTYRDNYNKGNGPRATPTIAGKYVITLGAGGQLQCLKLADGSRVWKRNVNTDYQTPPNFFGVGNSPLVADDLVLVNVGANGAGIVAFKLDTGKEVWKATSDEASYSSGVLTTVDGARRAIFLTRHGVVIVDPKTGKMFFRKRWRARNAASVNAATPLIIGDRVFVSSSYNTGALLLKLKKDGADELWQDLDTMSNHYNTSVYHDGHLYGFDGRQEAGANFRCVDLKSKKVRWNKAGFGCGSMVLAEGRLIVLTESGELLLVDASPKGFKELARAMVFEDTPCRAQIALANGLLYARDASKLVCFDLKKRAK